MDTIKDPILIISLLSLIAVWVAIMTMGIIAQKKEVYKNEERRKK